MLVHQQKYKKAEKYLKNSIAISADNFIAYLWLGICSIFLNNITKSKILLLQAIKILDTQHEQYHKNFSKQYYKRGLLHYKIGAIELSLNDLNKSLDLHRSNLDALILRSKVFLSKANYTDAVIDIEKIEQKFPKNKAAHRIKRDIKKHRKELQNLL